MPDNLPNPDASAVVTPPAGPPAPQTQSPDTSGQQIAQQPVQSFNTPAQSLPTPQQAQAAHHSKLGMMWNALMPEHTVWGPNTNNPNGPPVPTQVKDKPGQLFRSILAGAIMGGAAGQEAHNQNPYGGFAGGLMPGAKAGIQNQQAEAQKAQQQAQQQWQNQLTAKKEQREQTSFDTEQQVRKAQLLQANAETLRTNLLTQGSSFDLHQKVSDADKERISTFSNAGVKPVYEDIPESQMNDIIKNAPGSSALDWRHTGVKTVMDKDGNPSYEYTLSAYDPKTSAPLSPATVKQWDEDGLFKYHPEYKDVAKSGKVLSVDQFTALDRQAQNYSNQTLAKTKNDLDVEHVNAQIGEAKAAIAAHQATTRRENLSTSEMATEDARKNREENAWKHLSAAGNDPSKISAEDRVVIGRASAPVAASALAGIKTAAQEAQNGDADAKAQLPELWKQYNALSRLASFSNEASSGADPAVAAAVTRLKGLPQAQIDTALSNPAITPAQKAAIRQGLGLSSGTSGVDADSFRSLSTHDREMALAASNIPLAEEDRIRRSLGVSTPDDSKYANDIVVQRQIKKMKGQSPKQIADKLSDFDLTPGQLEAVVRGVKRAQ
jgi:hypothetical protein